MKQFSWGEPNLSFKVGITRRWWCQKWKIKERAGEQSRSSLPYHNDENLELPITTENHHSTFLISGMYLAILNSNIGS